MPGKVQNKMGKTPWPHGACTLVGEVGSKQISKTSVLFYLFFGKQKIRRKDKESWQSGRGSSGKTSLKRWHWVHRKHQGSEAGGFLACFRKSTEACTAGAGAWGHTSGEARGVKEARSWKTGWMRWESVEHFQSRVVTWHNYTLQSVSGCSLEDEL